MIKCVVCKHGEVKAGETTMTIDRGNMVVVIRNIPALVRETCGEEYVSSEVMKELEITRRTEERKQIFGRLAGKAAIADDFDAPLPDELLNEFEGESASIRIECKIDELRMSRVIECDEANNPSFGVDGQLPIRE